MVEEIFTVHDTEYWVHSCVKIIKNLSVGLDESSF